MKRLFTLAAAVLLAATAAMAQSLKFGTDGKFKIAQFRSEERRVGKEC